MNKETLEWNDDTLEVNDDGHVEGQAWYGSFADGHDVFVSVHSYDYEKYGRTKTNHVPLVTVTDSDGNIVSEPHTHDSHNPERAIEDGKMTAIYVVENPSEFIN